MDLHQVSRDVIGVLNQITTAVSVVGVWRHVVMKGDHCQFNAHVWFLSRNNISSHYYTVLWTINEWHMDIGMDRRQCIKTEAALILSMWMIVWFISSIAGYLATAWRYGIIILSVCIIKCLDDRRSALIRIGTYLMMCIIIMARGEVRVLWRNKVIVHPSNLEILMSYLRVDVIISQYKSVTGNTRGQSPC